MSLFLINPYILKIISQVVGRTFNIRHDILAFVSFIFGTKDKEVSNNLQYSGRSIVRTQGAGDDAFQSVDNIIASVGARQESGARVCIRSLDGTIYYLMNDSNNFLIFRDSRDDGVSFGNSTFATDSANGALTLALDSTNKIHIFWWSAGVGLRYRVYNASTQSFATATVTAHSDTTTSTNPYLAVTIDSNDIPHVCFASEVSDPATRVEYMNRIGGFWGTPINVTSIGVANVVFKFDITIDLDDIIQIIIAESNTDDVDAYIGNQNDATSFSTFVIDTTASTGTWLPSIVIDKKGDTHTCWIDSTGNIQSIIHIKAKAWSAWEVITTVVSGSNEDTSMTIDQSGHLYIFSTTSANLTQYALSTNNGKLWTSLRNHNIPSIVDEHVKTRWSFLNYHQPWRLDYSVNDITGEDIGINNSLSEASETYRDIDSQVTTDNIINYGANRTIVRTSTGILYVLAKLSTNAELNMCKSTNEGKTWSQVDLSVACDGGSAPCAIDSTGIIHCGFHENAVGLRYVTYDISDDTFGTIETVRADVTTGGSDAHLGITVDSNDKPHIIWQVPETASGTEVRYTNKVTGSWSTSILIDTSSVETHHVDITMNRDDFPLLTYHDGTAPRNMYALEGNQNNATSFENFTLEVDARTNARPQIVVDSQGNTHVTWVTNNQDVVIRTHPSLNNWQSWDTEVIVSSALNYEMQGMTIDSQNNLIVFATSSTDVTSAFKSIDRGATWTTIGTTHDTPTAVDNNIKCRWSKYNYYFPTELDYTVNFSPNLYYNKLAQTGLDHLYIVGRNPTNLDIEVWRSPTEGVTWEEVDDPNSPTGVDTNTVSCAIDGLDDIHIVWRDQGTGIRYEKFDISTQSHGTAETADVDTSTAAGDFVAVAIDTNNEPHVAYTSGLNSNSSRYVNHTGGSWNTDILVNGGDFNFAGITLDINDIPQIIFGTSASGNVKLGNTNNAVSFSNFNIVDSVHANFTDSIIIDSLGNTYISYVLSSGNLRFRKHNVGDAWTTWQTIVAVATGNFEDTSMMLDERSNILLMANNSSNVSQAFVSTDGGSTFENVDTDNMPNVVDEHIRLRWSFYHFANPSKVDYIIFDDTANDVYYNSGAIV